MKHQANSRFWAFYAELPAEVRALADKSFMLLKENPRHASLHFKSIGKYYSVRVGLGYRALGIATSEGILWFWIGNHADYDRLIG